MRAAYAVDFNDENPLAALEVGERPEPEHPFDGWATVEIKASALNHHDLWSLRGVGLAKGTTAHDPRLRRGRSSTRLCVPYCAFLTA
jgi:NADPH:quinone reductase-like Zn-dependent oxidoreductase